MTDLATLVLAVDSSSVPKGTAELDKLAAAGERAEAATDIFGKSTTAAAGRMRASTAIAVQQRAGLQQLGTQYSAAGTSAERFAAQTLQATQASVAMRGASSLLAGFLGGTFASVAIHAVGAVTSLAIAHLTGAEAKKKEKEAAEELIEATNDLYDATVREMRTTRDSIKVNILKADALRTQANEARAAAIAELELAKASLRANSAMAGRFDDMGAGGRSAAAGSAALAGANEITVGRLDAEIARQTETMKKNEATVRRLGGQLIQLDVAAKYDGMKAAADRFKDALSGLDAQLDAGTISYDAYRAAVDKATRTQIAEEKAVRDAGKNARESAREQAKAAREAAKAAREQAREIRELQSAYEGLERQFDPAAALARDFAKSMGNIETIRLAGLISDGQALNYTLAAAAEQAKKLAEVVSPFSAIIEKLQKDAGFDPSQPIIKIADVPQEVIDDYERIADAIRRANDNLLDMASYLQSIGGLAGTVGGLFEGALTGNFRGLGPVGLLINQLSMGPGGTEKQIANLTKNLNDIFGIGGQFGKDLATHLTQALNGAAIGATANSAILGRGGSGTGGAIGGALGNVAGSMLQKGITAAATSAFGATLGTALGTAVPVIGSIVGGLLGGALGGLLKSTPRGEATISGGGVFVAGNSGQFEAAAGDAANGVIDALNALAGDLGGWVDKALGSVTVSVRDGNWRVDPSGMGISKKSNGAIDFGQDGDAAVAFAIQELIKDGVIKGLRDSTMNLLKTGDFEQQLEKALAFEAVFQQLEAQANPFAAALREMQAGFAELTKVFNEAGATAGEFAVLQELQAKRLQELVDQASSNFRSTFFTDAEKLTFAKDQISSVLTPLGFGGVDTVEEYKALVASVDMASQAGLELFGTLMTLTDEFGAVKDAADAAADAAALTAAAADAAAQARAQMTSQLNIQLLQALGQSEAALTMQRALELQALDASLRPLQMQVWAAQDASKAMEDVARTTQAAAQAAEKAAQEASRIEADAIQRVDQAKNDLIATYRRERGELDETASRFRSFGDDLRAFRDSLTAQGGGLSRSQALVNLMKVGGLAGAGNEQALGQLPGTAREFLDVSRSSAKSLLDYQRDVALVANYVGAGIKAADKQVSNAERQIAALERQVGSLVDLNEGVLTVRQAIDQLQQAQRGQASAAEAAARARDEAAAKDRAAQLEEAKKLVITNEAIAFSNAAIAKALSAVVQGDAITVRGDADTPVYTSAV